jgi:hypothetical protein
MSEYVITTDNNSDLPEKYLKDHAACISVIPWMEKIIHMEISFRSMNFMRQ